MGEMIREAGYKRSLADVRIRKAEPVRQVEPWSQEKIELERAGYHEQSMPESLLHAGVSVKIL